MGRSSALPSLAPMVNLPPGIHTISTEDRRRSARAASLWRRTLWASLATQKMASSTNPEIRPTTTTADRVAGGIPVHRLPRAAKGPPGGGLTPLLAAPRFWSDISGVSSTGPTFRDSRPNFQHALCQPQYRRTRARQPSNQRSSPRSGGAFRTRRSKTSTADSTNPRTGSPSSSMPSNTCSNPQPVPR